MPTNTDYEKRYHDCRRVLGYISRGRSEYSKYSRKDLIKMATDLLNEFREEDRFNAAVEAYVEEHYKNAIVIPPDQEDDRVGVNI